MAIQSRSFPLLKHPIGRSVYPFQVLKYLALSDRWKDFVYLNLKKFITQSHARKAEQLTSCVSTLAVTSSLYLGTRVTVLVLKKLIHSEHRTVSLKLKNDKDLTLYYIYDLFSGIKIYDHYNNTCHAKDAIAKFKNFALKGSKNNSELDQLLRFEKYKFNEEIIDKFELDVLNKCSLVTQGCSFLFCIGIRRHRIFDHAYCLEVFEAPFSKKPRIRLIHSWIDAATCGEEILKRPNMGIQGSWSKEEFLGHVRLLRRVYVERNLETIEQDYMDCFGYSRLPRPLNFITDFYGIKLLGGDNFRYVVSPFRPESCIDNVRAIGEHFID